MARIPLSEQLEKRIGKRTAVKEEGGGGTLITEALVEKVRADESELLEIREDNSKEMKRLFKRAIAAALEEIGLAAERFAKREAPVDTGRLRNSITHALDMDDDAVYVGTNVEYAPYQEMGTHGRNGKWFLKHAAENHGDYYRRIMKKHLEGG